MTSIGAIGSSSSGYIQPTNHELKIYQVEVNSLINDPNIDNASRFRALDLLRSEIEAKLENEKLPPEIAAEYRLLVENINQEFARVLANLEPLPLSERISLPKPFGF